MRATLLTLIATPLFALTACNDYGGETESVSAVAAPAGPDFAAAVSAPGRTAEDMKLDNSRKPAEVLAFTGLKTGDAAVDIFAGGGYYSEIIGAAIGPTGSVVAVNPPQFISDDASKEKWAGVTGRQPNVSMLPSQLPDYKPAPNSLDFAMLHLIYHDFYWESEQYKFERMDPVAALGHLYAGIKPGGIVAVIDHAGNSGDTRAIVDKTHRIDPETVKADFAKVGFTLEAESAMFANPDDDLDKNVFDPAVRGKTDRFVMRFRKPT